MAICGFEQVAGTLEARRRRVAPGDCGAAAMRLRYM